MCGCGGIRFVCFFFQAEDGIRDFHVTGVQTCALPIYWLLASSNSILFGLTEISIRPTVSASPVGVTVPQKIKRHGRAGATLCQRIMRRAKLSAAPASMQASGMFPGLVEQRLKGGLIEAVTGVAELTIHPDLAALLGQQCKRVLTPQTDQGIARALR